MAFFFGGRRELKTLSPAALGYVSEAVSSAIDAFRSAYWTHFIGQSEEADREIVATAKRRLRITLPDADMVVIRSLLLARAAGLLHEGTIKNLAGLKGDATYYVEKLRTLTIGWSMNEARQSLCPSTRPHADTLFKWVQQYAPTLAKRLQAFTLQEIKTTVATIMREGGLARGLRADLQSLTQAALSYEMVGEIVRQAALDVAPSTLREAVLREER